MASLTFSNGKSIQINTTAIKYCKFEEVDDDWIKKFCLWSLYLHIVANGANQLQQIVLPGICESIATYLGTVKFSDKNLHIWYFITTYKESELLETTNMIITDDSHNVIKQLTLECRFNYES